MRAGLPMYDRPETAAANDRLWAATRDALRLMWRDIPERAWPLPETLTRGDDPWDDWLAPDLVLSQTCGLPYRARLHGKVTYVGTPVHDLPGTRAGYYYSVLVARASDPRRDFAEFDGATLAINDSLSQSGWAAPLAHAAAHGISFGHTVTTGAHRASARAVAERGADLAAIDAVTWSMITRWDGFARDLKEIGTTDPTPALPYISARGHDTDDLGFALGQAIAG